MSINGGVGISHDGGSNQNNLIFRDRTFKSNNNNYHFKYNNNDDDADDMKLVIHYESAIL